MGLGDVCMCVQLILVCMSVHMCVQLTADLWVDFVLPSLVVLKPDERIFKQLVQLMLQKVGADGGGKGGGGAGERAKH